MSAFEFVAGKLNAAYFPLLRHIDEIITEKKPVNIPWEKFTLEIVKGLNGCPNV